MGWTILRNDNRLDVTCSQNKASKISASLVRTSTEAKLKTHCGNQMVQLLVMAIQNRQ